MTRPAYLDAATLVRWLDDGDEIALLDVREAGPYGEGHPLHAANLPLSRLESEIRARVPRLGTRIVLVAEPHTEALAERRLAELGYHAVHVLHGGAAAWAAIGRPLHPSIHVASKAFAECVEHSFHTPAIGPAELQQWRAEHRPHVVLDGRTATEFARYHVPGARHCANAELVLHAARFVDASDTPIVVSCAGRTRGIMGAQSLISAGIPNPVYALAGGTQGWRLSGAPIATGPDDAPPPADARAFAEGRERARALAQRAGIPHVDLAGLAAWQRDEGRTTFVFDVRTPEEHQRSHLPGAIGVPGGQLLQTLDLWAAVRGARLVLVDDVGARADVTAYWLQQLGWEVAVLRDADQQAAFTSAAAPAGATLDATRWPPAIPAATAATYLAAGAAVLDAGSSADFQQRRLRGATWINRSRLDALPAEARDATVLLVTGQANEAHRLVARDLSERHPAQRVLAVQGDATAWQDAGLPVDESALELPRAERIDTLFWLHDRHAGNDDASRAYLAWEESLVDTILTRDDAGFRLPGAA